MLIGGAVRRKPLSLLSKGGNVLMFTLMPNGENVEWSCHLCQRSSVMTKE